MEGGFVLDFSNRTFAAFFHEVLGVDMNDSRAGTKPYSMTASP